jgi:hypothetical protein
MPDEFPNPWTKYHHDQYQDDQEHNNQDHDHNQDEDQDQDHDQEDKQDNNHHHKYEHNNNHDKYDNNHHDDQMRLCLMFAGNSSIFQAVPSLSKILKWGMRVWYIVESDGLVVEFL